MMQKFAVTLRAGAVFASGLLLAATVQAKPPQWEKIVLKGERTVTLADGSERTVDPSCSGGPVLTQAGPRPGNTEYSFFIKRGNPNKLIVAFDGGGACWDGLTCIGSALGGSATYTREIDETVEGLAQGEGLFDDRNPANPYKEYTKVFVPYCTADVHWGSRDTVYQFNVPGLGNVPWLIRHRGSDNVIAVVDWLQRNGRTKQVDLKRVRDLTVTGLSAGAYGTLNGFGFLAALTPNARQNLVADAGIGVLTPSFFATTLYPDASAVWGAQANLPPVPGFDTLFADASANPLLLVPLAFQSLSAWKPKAHFASITAELDLVQVGFYALSKSPPVLAPGPQEAFEWYAGMKTITAATASLPNYRYFIEEGTFHTFLADDDYTYGVGANGVSVAQWIREMIKPGNRAWETLEAPPPF